MQKKIHIYLEIIGIAKLAFDMQQNEIGTFDFKQNRRDIALRLD